MKTISYLAPIIAGALCWAPLHAAVPAQFVAKIYTEALGRAPDAAGWSGRIEYFNNTTCNTATLSLHANDILSSSEFNSAGYNNAAKLLLLYRTIFDREPDQQGFDYYHNQLESGVSFYSVFQTFVNSSEFSQLSSYICSGQPYYFNILGRSGYAISMPGVASMTQSSLQSALDAAGPGGVVALPNMTVIYLTAPLSIPSGVTLTTVGSPSPAAHGNMARIVRDPQYGGGEALIKLHDGARLKNVWVDGQRGAAPALAGVPQPFVHGEINVQALSGLGTEVSSNFIANTAGWSSLQAFGVAETGVVCQANTMVGNTITVYSSSNKNTAVKTWADGISDSCEDSVVTNNQIVDATDGGIVLFRPAIGPAGVVQRSQVTDNIILNAGNSAFIAIAVDPLYQTGGCPAHGSFAGSYVGRNVMWTGPVAIVEIALAVGTSEWFYSSGGCLGTGANVSNNSSNGFRIRVNDGIAVQGMLNATVQGNNLLTTRVRKGRCASHDVSAGVSAGIASGSIQPYVNTALKDCIN